VPLVGRMTKPAVKTKFKLTRVKKGPAMPQDLARFSADMTEARALARLSQCELAEQVGISNKTLNNVERGNNWPSVPVLIKLRRSLTGNDKSLLK